MPKTLSTSARVFLASLQRFRDQGFLCNASYSKGDVYGKGLPAFVFFVLGVDVDVVDEKAAVCVTARAGCPAPSSWFAVHARAGAWRGEAATGFVHAFASFTCFPLPQLPSLYLVSGLRGEQS